MTSANSPVRCDALTKRYGNGDAAVTAVDRVSVAFVRGQFTSIMGPSGSGKTTLLQLLAGLDQPTEGEVHVAGKRLGDLSDNALTDLRRDHVGFIFQAFNLIPSLTAEQNITLPLMISGKKPDQQRVAQTADLLGLTDRLRHRPAQLSGGQQQRVAIARALVTRPEVIFADEPTGSLDTATGRIILSELRMACRELGQTIIMVTHDPAASSYSDRCLLMADGQIRAELTAPTYAQITEEMARISAAANLTGAVVR